MTEQLKLSQCSLSEDLFNDLVQYYREFNLDEVFLAKRWDKWKQDAALGVYAVEKGGHRVGTVIYDPDRSTIVEAVTKPPYQDRELAHQILDLMIIRENLLAVELWQGDRERYQLMVDYGFRPTRTYKVHGHHVVKLDLSTAILLQKMSEHNLRRHYREKETVVIEQVPPSLEYDEIRSALADLIDKLGGIQRFVQSGQRVVIKPNIVSDHGLKKGQVIGGVVTDKKVVKALVELLLPLAGEVVIAEGSSINRSATTKMFAHYGYEEVVAMDPQRVRLVDLNTDELVEKKVPSGKRMQSRMIPVTLDLADVIISVPVMKIHFAAVVSLSIKNLQGAVPPLEKYMSHFFGLWQNLVNINHLVKPDLIIIDGTTGQEDFGPISGTPKPMNLLIGGTNPVAVDAVTMRIMGIDPLESPPVRLAYMQGFGPVESEMIDVIGPRPEQVRDPFKQPQLELDSGRDFAVHIGTACQGCRAYLHFTLSKLRKPDPQNPERMLIDRPFDKKVNVYLGPTHDFPVNPEETNIFMGICQQHHAHLGTHLPGCPPHSEVIIDGIFNEFPDVQKAKYADKSEEATLGEMLETILARMDQD